MSLADRANQYIDQQKPWIIAKHADKAAEVQGICTQGLNLFRALMIYLKPVLPQMAAKTERFFAESPWAWRAAARPLLDAPILPYEPLAVRLDPKAVARLVQPEGPATAVAAPLPDAPQSAAATPAAPVPAAPTPAAPVPVASISIDDFARIDLRVAKILEAQYVTGSDKLLKLRVDLGEFGEREILSGIRSAYDPASLVGRLTVVVANLEPRKMRFGISSGMVLAAGAGGTEIFLLTPDQGASAGMHIK